MTEATFKLSSFTVGPPFLTCFLLLPSSRQHSKALGMKQVSSPAHGSLCCAPPASARWPPCPRLKCFPISWLPKTQRLHPVLSLPWARRSQPFQEPCFVLRTGIRNQDVAAGCPHHCRGALASRGSQWPEPEEGARARTSVSISAPVYAGRESVHAGGCSHPLGESGSIHFLVQPSYHKGLRVPVTGPPN